MNSRERLLAAIHGGQPDHVPLTFWCFGFAAPPHLQWSRDGRPVVHWYTGRLEHLHTLPEPWRLPEDDFHRVLAWRSLGVDDVLEVSPPWGLHPSVRYRDWEESPTADQPCARLCREYQTPEGTLRHVVRRTNETVPPGWVIQPDHVPLIEDFNIPRGVRHAVVGSEDLPKLRYLLSDPTPEALAAYRRRMDRVRQFADAEGVMVAGWSAFGMDLVVWLMGVEAAVLAAMTRPDFFGELVEIVSAFDRRRTEIMLDVGGVDLVMQRGWYSSTDFWSPRLFERFLLAPLKGLAGMVHQAGKPFGYTMTTGILAMADHLLAAGVDVLYYVDPVQDRADLARVKAKLGGRMALAGGVNSGVTLAGGSVGEIRAAVAAAVETFAPGGGFILAPVDAVFPDTPWSSVEAMIDAWKAVREPAYPTARAS